MTTRLKQNKAMAAASAISAEGQSKVPANPCGQSTLPEEQRQIEDYPDHSGAVNFSSLWIDSTSGSPARMKRKDGRKVSQAGGDGTGQEGLISTEYLLHVTPDEADEGHHHDKRPRRGLTQGQTVNHVRQG